MQPGRLKRGSAGDWRGKATFRFLLKVAVAVLPERLWGQQITGLRKHGGGLGYSFLGLLLDG